MSLVLKDRVRETTTVLGTSDATLLGAVTGFQAFSVVGNGNTCYYTISDQSGGNWEVGIGTYSSVGPTLARTTILASSNSGSIVSFPAGTKDVFLTLPAEVAVVSSNNPSTAGYVLSSNGTGVAPSWVAGTSITVGAAGSNTQVQYNNSGVLGASSNFTFDGTNIGLAGGTANGVAYLNGSKVLTTGSALTFDGSSLTVANGDLTIGTNGKKLYVNYIANNSGTDLNVNGSTNSIFTIAGSEQMRLTSTGLGIGTSSPSSFLADANKLVVGTGSGSNGLSIYSGSSSKGRIAFADGTAGSDPYAGLIDYDHSVNAMLFSTNGGSERMRLDSSGNLGLGVTPVSWSPSALQVGGWGGIQDMNGVANQIAFRGNSYYNGGDKFIQATGYASTIALDASSGAVIFYKSTNQSSGIGSAVTYSAAMTLDASGNLGIGTTSPHTKLHVYASGSSFIKTEAGSGGASAVYQLKTPDGEQAIYSNSNALIFSRTSSFTESMRIDSSGNVGIGTSSPSAKLHVAGNALVAQPSSANSYVSVSGSSGSYSGIVSLQRGGTEDGSVYCASTNYNPASASIADLVFSNGGGGRNFRWANNTTLAMTLDSSGNLGLGVTPSSVLGGYKFFELGVAGSTFFGGTSSNGFAYNGYYNSGWRYSNTGLATRYDQNGGQHQWYTAPSGTAGNPISFTQAMTLDASGNLALGTTTNKVTELSGAGNGLTIGGATAPCIGIWDTSDASYLLTLGQVDTGSYVLNKANGPLILGTNNAERMRIDSSGNVGIGTSSPTYPLEVYTATANQARVRISSTTETVIHQCTNYAGNFYFAIDNSTGSNFGTSGYGRVIYSDQAYPMIFSTNATERMRIDSSGNVGIGTSSPDTPLQIYSSAQEQLRLSRNATSSSGYMTFYANNASSTQVQYAGILGDVASSTAGSHGGNLLFYTTGSGTSAERMRIDSSGILLVGTTTTANKAALTGSIGTAAGFANTIALGTVAQNATVTATLPGTTGLAVVWSAGNNTGMFTWKGAGGSSGCFAIWSTNGSTDFSFGGTTEPSGGNYGRLWISGGNQISFKNVSSYTGPYYICVLASSSQG